MATNLSKQRGMATLLVALVLLFAITLMTFSSAKIGVTEQRTAANDVRAKEAVAIAEAAIDNAIVYLSANKSFIDNASSTSGWLYTLAPKWEVCASGDSVLPCGDGTTNIYPTKIAGNWLAYRNVPNMTPMSSTYNAGVHFITRNLGTGGALKVADYPRIDIITDVRSAVDPLAGTARVKQIVQAYSEAPNPPDAVITAQGTASLTGSSKVWGNPTGLHTHVANTTYTMHPNISTPADYIKIIGVSIHPDQINPGNLPSAPADSPWKDESNNTLTPGKVNDLDNTTYARTAVTGGAAFRVELNSSDSSYVGKPISDITIMVRAKILGGGDDKIQWAPIVNSAPATSGNAVQLTGTFTDYTKNWPYRTGTTAWTDANINDLVVEVQAVQEGGAMSEIQVSKVCVMVDYGAYGYSDVHCDTPYIYEVGYTLPIQGGAVTRVDRGTPLSVRTSDTTTYNGSGNTCRDWSATTIPTSAATPYPEWYPADADNQDCHETGTPRKALSSNNTVYSDVFSGDTTIPSDLFMYLFNYPRGEYEKIKYHPSTVIRPDCEGIDISSKGLFWIEGDCDLNSAGTLQEPVSLVVEGNLKLNSNTKVYGLIFLFTLPGDTTFGTVAMNGNATVVGSLLSDHSIDFGSGSLDVVYNRTAAEGANNVIAGFAKLPGGWLDQF